MVRHELIDGRRQLRWLIGNDDLGTDRKVEALHTFGGGDDGNRPGERLEHLETAAATVTQGNDDHAGIEQVRRQVCYFPHNIDGGVTHKVPQCWRPSAAHHTQRDLAVKQGPN